MYKKTQSFEEPRAKKVLGQHWLRDEVSLAAMCEAAQVSKDDLVLEVGPGTGALTRKLVERAGQVISVELDEDLAAKLPSRVPANNLTVVNQNILEFDLTQLPAGYKVVANIPYYLTSYLLKMLCESPNPPKIIALLVQKEIAERATAKPGNLSILGVSVQFFCEAKVGRIVPKELFMPPPKVDSQILVLTPRLQHLFPDVNARHFFQIVRAGFASRRKTLINSLSGGLQLQKTEVQNLLQQAGINPGARAQELSLEQWYTLSKVFTPPPKV